MTLKSFRNIKKEILAMNTTYVASADASGTYVTSAQAAVTYASSAYGDVTWVKSS